MYLKICRVKTYISKKYKLGAIGDLPLARFLVLIFTAAPVRYQGLYFYKEILPIKSAIGVRLLIIPF